MSWCKMSSCYGGKEVELMQLQERKVCAVLLCKQVNEKAIWNLFQQKYKFEGKKMA